MSASLHPDDAVVVALYLLAVAAQLVAAGAAMVQIRRAGRYRGAWAMVSLGLGLMVVRRLEPVMEVLAGGPARTVDAALGLAISGFLAVGLLGVRELFAQVQRQQGVLYERATRDALTGLVNRQHALQLGALEVERARRGAHPVGVLMVDIDHFKLVNDQHGHQKGDQVLQLVARTLSDQLRVTDVLGRLGGEEFLVILPGGEEAQVREVAERLRAGVETACGSGAGLAQPLTISIGRAHLVPGDRPAEEQLAAAMVAADAALYRAKAEGRNRVVAAPEVAQV
jgi:diguanylate cyclase (GGDEF)-like protein